MSKVYEHKRCPLGPTCPHIDEAVSLIEESVLDGLTQDTAYLITQQLEELREQNATLRQFGCEEATEYDNLMVCYQKALKNVAGLNQELRSLKQLIEAAIGGL